jgi:anti-sigma factor RsiW
MITCRDCAELLFDFTSDNLPPEYRMHVEQHLTLCSSCVAYLESYRLTIEMARQLRRLPLPANLARQLQALLKESQRSQQEELHPGA